MKTLPAAIEQITRRILVIRDHKMMIDFDLAELYGVETRVLVRRSSATSIALPRGFYVSTERRGGVRFEITVCDLKRRRYAPYAFTEQGVAMLFSVLRSPQAIAVNV